jgi:hypothetical protein
LIRWCELDTRTLGHTSSSAESGGTGVVSARMHDSYAGHYCRLKMIRRGDELLLGGKVDVAIRENCLKRFAPYLRQRIRNRIQTYSANGERVK